MQTYRFIAGHPPERVGIVPEAAVVLNGKINGFHDGTPTNLPIAGAAMEVYDVSPETGERRGAPVHAKVVGADGLWGPFTAKPGAYYEFVIRADGFAITHIYRSPFPRSSELVHVRPTRLTEIDKRSPFAVTMVRARGYLGVGRDRMSLDGVSPPPGLSPGVPGLGAATIKLDERSVRSVVAEFNGERIAVRTWPANEDHAVRAEFHY